MTRPAHAYKRVVWAGDSFTAGIFATYPSAVEVSDFPGNSVTGLIFNSMRAQNPLHGSEMFLRVGAVGGWLEAYAQSLAAFRLDLRPDLIILAAGQNDWGGYPEDDARFRTNVQTIMDYIFNESSAAMFTVAIPTQQGFSVERKAGHTRWNKILQEESALRGFGYSSSWEWALLPSGTVKNADCLRITISSISGTGSLVTVNTSVAHDFNTDDRIIIDGTDGYDNEYDGALITVTGTQTFVYAGTGTVTETPANAKAIKPIDAYVPTFYVIDGYHPNNTGFQAFHDAMWADMEPWLVQTHRRPLVTSRPSVSRATTVQRSSVDTSLPGTLVYWLDAPIYNIADYGGVGSGLLEDAPADLAAAQAIFDLISARGKGILYAPAATWRVQWLEMPDETLVLGDINGGTIFKGSAPNTAGLFRANGKSNLAFSYVTLDGDIATYPTTARNMTEFENCHGVSLYNCRLQNNYGYGVRALGDAGMGNSDFIIDHVTTGTMYGTIVHLLGVNNASITYNNFGRVHKSTLSLGQGIQFGYCDGLVVADNTLLFSDDSFLLVQQDSKNFEIHRNSVNCRGAGMWFDTCEDGEVSYNTIQSVNDGGMRFGYAQRVYAHHNFTNRTGDLALNAEQCDSVRFEYNTVRNPGLTRTGEDSRRSGIGFKWSTNMTVVGNTATDDNVEAEFAALWRWTGSSWIDNTRVEAEPPSTFTLLSTTGERFYIGSDSIPEAIAFDFTVAGNYGETVQWQYWNGTAWTNLNSPTPKSSGWQFQDLDIGDLGGSVATRGMVLIAPTDWAKVALTNTPPDTVARYWLRVMAATVTTPAQLARIFIPGPSMRYGIYSTAPLEPIVASNVITGATVADTYGI